MVYYSSKQLNRVYLYVHVRQYEYLLYKEVLYCKMEGTRLAKLPLVYGFFWPSSMRWGEPAKNMPTKRKMSPYEKNAVDKT